MPNTLAMPKVGSEISRDFRLKMSSDLKRSSFKVTTNKQADDGFIVEPDGLEWDDYDLNPVVLWSHGWETQRGGLPIGKNVNRTRTADGWVCELEYDDDAFSQDIKRKVEKGFLSAASIRVRIIDGGYQTRDGKEVYVVTRAKVREYSIVPVGSDSGALAVERSDQARFEAHLAKADDILRQFDAKISRLEALLETETTLKNRDGLEGDTPKGSGDTPTSVERSAEVASDGATLEDAEATLEDGEEAPIPAKPEEASSISPEALTRLLSNMNLSEIVDNRIAQNLGKR